MKKLNVIKALFAAAALTFALPGCSDLSTTDGNSALVEKEGKVGVKLAVSESYRTIISELPSDLKYSLTITGTGEGAKSENYTLESLTDSVVYYLEAGEYTFTLSGLSGEKTIVSGTTKQTVSASSSTVSIALSAVTGEAVDVTLNLTILSGYGVKSVEASVYTDSELATASTDASDKLTFDSESSALKGTIVSGANKWVKIDLKDESGTIIGSKTEQLFMIAGSDIEAPVTVPVKQYKATVKLTATEAKSITLKNSAVTSASYTGIVWAAATATATEESGVYTYSAYIPAGSYSISVDGSSLGTVSSVETVSVDASKAITGITAELKTGAPTFYSDDNDEALKNLILENILITVNYSDSSSDEPIPAKEAGKDAVASITIDSTKIGEAQNATVTYSGQTTTVSVTLAEVLPESIAVKTAPAKTTYTVGDELDLTGLVIDLTYNNGDKEEIHYDSNNDDDFETSGFNSAAAVSSQTVTVTYEGKSATFNVVIKSAVISVYELSGESATISLGKTQVGTIKDKANNETNQYLSVASDNWSSENTIGDYTDVFYNLNGEARNITAKVKGVAGFDLYVKNSNAGRTFTVKIGDGEAETITHPGSVNGSDIIKFTFNTASTDELSIVIGGGSGSVYPGYIVAYSAAQTIPVETVEITGAPTAAVLLADGSVQFGATVAPARATAKTLTWTSGDESVATVDSTGNVTFVGAGTATITATAPSGVKAEAKITIQAAIVAVTGVSLDQTSATIKKAGTVTLTATVAPENASNKKVTWTSSKEDVATVENGVVTGVGSGTATITVTTEDGEKTAEFEVTVEVAYVAAGKYNLTTKAISGYTVDGDASGKWDSQNAGDSQTHDNITVTAKNDSSGPNIKPESQNAGSIVFDLNSTLTLTFTDSNKKGITITPSNGGSVKIGDAAAVTEITGTLGADGTETTVTLTAGSYVLYGASTSGSAKVKTLTFAAVE
ncbi:MAG: Ig-like domain-containing protein [Treponema sp.]|nr:Ig-like domain-containing protein [Treponema sp.]